MSLSRRDALATLGGLAVGAAARPLLAHQPVPAAATHGFPRKDDFALAPGYTYINGAYTHPMPAVAVEAVRQWTARRATVGGPPAPPRADPRVAFAALINADPDEVSFLPNTSTGENWVVEALGIGRGDGNVVTDALHFEGALIHLQALQRQGLDLRIAPARDGRVALEDLARLVDRRTRLVEVSLVSMYNGFQHDLKAVCDLAHAHGALVYADVIQGVGAVPFDVRACGVDIAATASYKWLMGDFGLGFLYVRRELLERLGGARPHWSYESTPDAAQHLSPFDPQYPTPVTWTPGRTAAHHVQLGTYAIGVSVALAAAIPYIRSLGVEAIQAHRVPLLRRLQQEMPRLGFRPQTPEDSTSPIVTFAHPDTRAIAARLEAARVNVRVAPTWVRISPSVYNDMADVERLLDALA